jgi:hypothetical protein
MDAECAKCSHLSDCHQVTERMIVEKGYCNQFAMAEQGVLSARADIIGECGPRALRYELPHRKLMSVKPKARRRKRNV